MLHHLFWSATYNVKLSKWPCYFRVVPAQASVHAPPGAQVHDFFQSLLSYVNLNIWSIFTEAKACMQYSFILVCYKCLEYKKPLAWIASHKSEKTSQKIVFEWDWSLGEITCHHNFIIYPCLNQIAFLSTGIILQTWGVNTLAPVNTRGAEIVHSLVEIVDENLRVKSVGDLEILAQTCIMWLETGVKYTGARLWGQRLAK